MHISTAPNAFHVYCNQAEFALSPWDITLTVSEMTGREGNVLKAMRHGSIVMHPGHAKALLGALAQTVHTYESQFGKIDLDGIAKFAESHPSNPKVTSR